MATIVTIDAGDQITTSRADLNTNFANLNSDKIETSVLDTDTTLAANSDAKIPSQKAVKAYVDAGGNVNASTTGKGIVEEATDAEVVAGTDTGGTGARLFVPPSKLNTQIDAKLLEVVPIFQQTLPTSTKEDVAGSAGCVSGSNTSGSVFFFMVKNTGYLYRFERDSLSGLYYQTHTVDPTLSVSGGGDIGGIIVIGSYVYVFSNDGANIVCSRFLAADLTGEQVMTVPSVACTSDLAVWTDGTDAYIVSAASDTTSRKWTVSGTTFSASSTATITTGLFASATYFSSMYDGTSSYLVNRSTNTLTIFKNTVIDGSSRTSSTFTINPLSDVSAGVLILNVDAGRIYLGYMFDIYDEAAAIVSAISLFPLTKP